MQDINLTQQMEPYQAAQELKGAIAQACDSDAYPDKMWFRVEKRAARPSYDGTKGKSQTLVMTLCPTVLQDATPTVLQRTPSYTKARHPELNAINTQHDGL